MKIKKFILLLVIGVIYLGFIFIKPASSGIVDCTQWDMYCQDPGGSIDLVHYRFAYTYLGVRNCYKANDYEHWSCTSDPDDAHCDSNGFYYYLTNEDCVKDINSYSAGCCGTSGGSSVQAVPCSSLTVDKTYASAGETFNFTLTAEQKVDSFKLLARNLDNVDSYGVPMPVNPIGIKNWHYIEKTFSTPQKTATLQWAANDLFVDDENWGNQQAVNIHIIGYVTLEGKESPSTVNCMKAVHLEEEITCPTVPACSTQGYVNSCPLGSTCVPRSITISAPDGCTDTRDCQLVCPVATCSDYVDPSGIVWKDTVSDRSAVLTIPISNPPSGCPKTVTKTCYTTNARPTNQSVTILPPSDKILNFSSTTHSGRGLVVNDGGGVNNPVRLHARYEDVNGRNDIQAMYVWWNPYPTKVFPTPNRIATGEPQTNSNQNFGFMIARDDTGAWNKVYVPRTSGTDRLWIEKEPVNDDIVIVGLNKKDMVELSDFNITNYGISNGIQLDLQMKFLNDPSNDIVRTRIYNLWAMANDYVGFTAFETDGNIKDDEFWKYSGTNWGLDMGIPNMCEILDITGTEEGEKLTLNIIAKDIDEDAKLSYVSLTACASGISEIHNLTSDYISSYELVDCGVFNSNGIDITSEDNLLGADGHSPGNTYNKEVGVELNGNAEGSITFYLTVMDEAGNFDQDPETYKLEQWVMVKDGFVFGKGGVSSSSRALEAGSWANEHPILGSFNEEKADLTNQVLMGGTSSLTSLLGDLVRYSENKSFKVAKYPGILMSTPYSELLGAYHQKAANNTSFEYKSIESPLSGSISGECTDITKDFCILETEDSLNITGGFNCDGKGLIIAKGDITITPNFESGDTASEACIILSGGNITIQPGSPGEGSPVPYDKVHAYLIANGEINILADSNDDGLYVNGGLAAFTPTSSTASVFNERKVNLGEMGVYPVLFVENNSKYGFLSKDLFGSQFDIFKLEIGFKPF